MARRFRAPSAFIVSAAFAAAVLIFGAAVAPACGQVACSYQVAAVITPPPSPPFSSPIYPTAISPNGRWVVGYYNPGLSQYSRGFWFDMTTMQFHTLPMPAWGGGGALGTAIYDVNDAGWAVGTYWINSPPAVQRGIVFDLNTQTYVAELMPRPGAAWCYATGINSQNQVCGTRSIGSGGDTVNPLTAFLWNGNFTDLGVMNGPSSLAFHVGEDGTVVGLTGGNVVSRYSRGFVVHEGVTVTLPPVPGGINSAAFASTSPQRVILSGMTPVDGGTYPRGWAFFDGTFFDLGILPGHLRVFPRLLDTSGQVFGWCTRSNGSAEAFVWRNGAMIPLASLVNSSTTIIRQATGASDQGRVVGPGVDSQGISSAIVLEPIYPRIGDINCDTIVTVSDLLGVIVDWGDCFGCSTDVDGDGHVDVHDLIQVILNWG